MKRAKTKQKKTMSNLVRKWSQKSVRSIRKGEGDYGGKDLWKR